ncbi:MAG: tRNA (adenosine(37)-N6)-threonylcarbamoyltransferase complex dimerization subunit type 1 TsaB [Saprospiraceae bacterium]|nr:tRNA (adenosine(37)-N6)-threonylcarbamoyltransferase complex dimerization subunit type 1 TsaB [Saprospiraceae bacterium]
MGPAKRSDPYILCIETSGWHCSVALCRSDRIIAERTSSGKYDHSAMLAPQVRDMLAEAGMTTHELAAVALSAGPGSYTGLRVGTSTAKAICFASGCPLVAVDTLEAVAREGMERSPDGGIYFPVLDARRMEVYVAAFDGRGERLLPDMAIEVDTTTFERLIAAGERIVICGPAAEKCRAVTRGDTVNIDMFAVHARHLAQPALERYFSAQFSDNVLFTPKYIKAPHITKSVKPPF